MPFVQQILNSKSDPRIWSVAPEDSLALALRELTLKNVAALLVMEEDSILGIITERDIVRASAARRCDFDTTRVREIMCSQVLYTTPEQTAEDCMALMTDSRVRHLPVIEHGKLVGLISIGDIVKVLISEKEFLIEQLTCYINGAEKSFPLSGMPFEDRTETNLLKFG